MNGPKVGERWRVTIEGTVLDNTGTYAYLDNDQAAYSVNAGTWERLPDPEPYWESGELVLAADGKVWQRGPVAQPKCWLAPGSERSYPDTYAKRPLTRLVPEAKP